MDKLGAMRTFVRVVEAGTFSSVANETGTTQGAVSKQVAALERELGAKLLTRTTRSLALTDDGERYFADARRLILEIADAEGALKRGEQQLSGLLRIAASVGYGRLKLMPIIESFLLAHPEVKVDVRLSDGFTDLIEQGIDVAIRLGDLPDSSLVARRVGTYYRVPLAHRRYLRALGRKKPVPRDPEDLTQHNCIVYGESAGRNAWTFVAGAGAREKVGDTRVVRVNGNLLTNSSEVIRSAVLSGLGIAYAPTWLFDEELANGEVQRLLPDWQTLSTPIHLVSPRERRQSAKVRAFSDHVAQVMGPPAR